ncbi:MAG TPA: autotransporter-associated beta strand repeat-containing protein [Chthoniobacteraceae bacterium]|nr:autotransporter-associated beta strand repeat-containing protein [Chthoniobacteraceae bacterium]
MAFLTTAALGANSQLQAASGTWSAPGGGQYSTPGNWSGGIPDGESDSATFTDAGGGTVQINGNPTIQKIIFDGSASAYLIAPPNDITQAVIGSSIEATGTGANAQVISASVKRRGSTTISNNYDSAEHTLTLSGNLIGWTNVSTTLTLGGSNTGANTISGVINDDTTGSKTTLTKTGTGTWILSGQNTYKGDTNINGGMLYITGVHLPNTLSTYTIDGGALGGVMGTIGASSVTLMGTAGSSINVSGMGLGSIGSQNALSTPGELSMDLEGGTLDISQAGAGALKFVLNTPGASDTIRISNDTLEIGEGVLGISNFTFDTSNWEEEGAEGTYVLFSTTSVGNISGFLDDENLSTILGGYRLTLSLGTGEYDTNTLELDVAAVPEPSLLSALLVGTVLLLGARRWRRQSPVPR